MYVVNVHVYVTAEDKTRAFSALLEMLRWFAGQQIRNTAVREKSLFFQHVFINTYMYMYVNHMYIFVSNYRLLEATSVMPVPSLTSIQC